MSRTMNECLELRETWKKHVDASSPLMEELLALNEKETFEAFYQDLSFGTGGLRGVRGVGTNRINLYIIRKATRGLANYVLKHKGAERGVAIAHDSRILSPEFALEAAKTLAAAGIKVYLFDSLRPTPELSFALRELKCIAGIVITASHNPSKYNGYKVYWEDGAQVTPPHDKGIMAEVNAIEDIFSIPVLSEEEARSKGLLSTLGADMDEAYDEAMLKCVQSPDALKKYAPEMKVVYTPLHGTGNLPVQRILKKLGFTHVHVVPEQEQPDGRFPTVPYPNPEDPRAFELALRLAHEVDADLVLATDPDADRLGVYAKGTDGEYHAFTGNMSGSLICAYELEARKRNGKLAPDGAVVSTIVSTRLAKRLAEAYGRAYFETLTGFKFIGEKIREFEEAHSHTYEFGFEESYGCLIGTYARDKDAISACMALAEAACFYRSEGKTLVDAMEDIFRTYGYYHEGLKTAEFEGVEGSQKILHLMDTLRQSVPEEIIGYKVLEVRDYEKSVFRSLVTGETRPSDLPKSNVLYYELENDAWFCARPSGTEPKIKFYYGIRAEKREHLEAKDKEFLSFLDDFLKNA